VELATQAGNCTREELSSTESKPPPEFVCRPGQGGYSISIKTIMVDGARRSLAAANDCPSHT
jgi:hypothetical protein